MRFAAKGEEMEWRTKFFVVETGSFFVNATMFRTLAFTLRAPDPGAARPDFISVRVMKKGEASSRGLSGQVDGGFVQFAISVW